MVPSAAPSRKVSPAALVRVRVRVREA